jgi:hypothetical protein
VKTLMIYNARGNSSSSIVEIVVNVFSQFDFPVSELHMILK